MTRMVPAGTSHSPAKRGERNMLLIRLEAALQDFTNADSPDVESAEQRKPLPTMLGLHLEDILALPGSPSHSLSYFYLQLPVPSQGLPPSFLEFYLDDQPIARFDSLTRKMEPLVPWMEEAENETFLPFESVFRANLEKLSKLDRSAGGLHIWQVNLGCELWEDGGKAGFLHYGYDGMDFISFDKGTLRWVTAQHQAQKVKEEWEEDPGWSKTNKVFLEETCIEALQRYLSYKNKTLQRIEPPVGKVTSKVVNERLEVLICQAFGFYSREIWTTWTRDGEVCEYETLHRNVVPNSDGTYYVLLSIEIDPKERDHFWCRLEHEGLQEPLVLSFKEERGEKVMG
ncbi:major histocompatibility complex class I-related gene protein-like [Thamnophis elegans]|uniref:major histocompatibility complex class I-related gene protein-like n=1 Tax=Thamnophis elegans TaxID=35005 RepID=UPI001376BB78|nr:major histocompatibility complex class I-related gene protein-like [Thamnophis elegans]